MVILTWCEVGLKTLIIEGIDYSLQDILTLVFRVGNKAEISRFR